MRAITLLQVCVLIAVSIIVEIPTARAGDSAFEGLMIRGRAATVIPQESADISVIGGDIDIDKSLVPELDISYFFTENIAAELILAITPHEAQATNTSLGRVNLDVKKLWISTDVSINNGAINADVDINPWIVGVGVGYRF
jgi:outer membrane protein